MSHIELFLISRKENVQILVLVNEICFPHCQNRANVTKLNDLNKYFTNSIYEIFLFHSKANFISDEYFVITLWSVDEAI